MKMEQSEFESMRVAIGRRDTGAIRQLLETGFDLTDTPVTSGGREQPYYYIGQLLQIIRVNTAKTLQIQTI